MALPGAPPRWNLASMTAIGIMNKNTMAARTPWPKMSEWYCGIVENRLPMPLYRIVSKGKPMRFGSKKSFLVKSHVPSPTTKLSDEYETAPGADSASVGAMAAVAKCCYYHQVGRYSIVSAQWWWSWTFGGPSQTKRTSGGRARRCDGKNTKSATINSATLGRTAGAISCL